MTEVNKETSSPGARRSALNELILRSIVDHAVVTLDAHGVITSWNEGAEHILGWTEEEAMGRSSDIFFTDADTAKDRAQTEMKLALEKGRAEDVRWHVRKNGEKFWGSGLMMPLLRETDADGTAVQDSDRVEGFVKIFRDRTAERDSNRRIKRLQDRATLAMRHSGSVGVYDIDLRTSIVTADPTCAELHSVLVEAAEKGTPIATFFDGIHEEDKARVRASLEAALNAGTDFDETYRVISPDPRPKWVDSQAAIQLDEEGMATRLTGIVVDITEQRERIRMQEARLKFAEQVRGMKDQREIAALASRVIGETLYAVRAGHGNVDAEGDMVDVQTDWNAPGFSSIEGKHAFSNFGSFTSVLREGHDVLIVDAQCDPLVEDPEPLEKLHIRSLVNLPLMEHGQLKALLFVNDAEPRDWNDDEVMFLRAMFDRTYAAIEGARYETERDLLAGELAHRIKNTLAMAQVIVTQTLRNQPDLADERKAIAERLSALAGAQDVLTHSQRHEADIMHVVSSTLAPHRSEKDRIIMKGPSLLLQSQQVLGLSLALHELATNAAKYGALSNEAGRVRIHWSENDNLFEFHWIEEDGPPITSPVSQGFGSTILDRLAGSYFGGTSKLTFASDGIRFGIEGKLIQ